MITKIMNFDDDDDDDNNLLEKPSKKISSESRSDQAEEMCSGSLFGNLLYCMLVVILSSH